MEGDLGERIAHAAEVFKAAGAHAVYLFGSAAIGTIREDSDVDMAVSGLPPERFFETMGEAHSILGRTLDLIDLDEQNLFTEYLKKKGLLHRVA